MLSALFERIGDFRNRAVRDPSFRRWATRFAPTRLVARRQAKALFDLTAGFVYSQILTACMRVDLFEILSQGPLDTPAIAARTGLAPEAAETLLRAASALRLVEPRSGGRHALGSLGAALVDNPGVKAMVLHHEMLYRDLGDPLALLEGRTTLELNRYWAYADGMGAAVAEPDRHAGYTALMAASQELVTTEILDAYPIGRHRRLLDVGGGDGTFLIAAARAAPDLALTLFDLPPVAAIAERNIRSVGLCDRATVVGGDLFKDELPAGADLVVLNRILHDHDDGPALAILRAARRAIAPGGTLLVAEPMAGRRGAEASIDAYFGFYLLAMGQGRPRRPGEIVAMLREAGFHRAAPVRTHHPLIARLVAGEAV